MKTLSTLKELLKCFKEHGDKDLNDIPVSQTMELLQEAISETTDNLHNINMAILLLHNYRQTFQETQNGYSEITRTITALAKIANVEAAENPGKTRKKEIAEFIWQKFEAHLKSGEHFDADAISETILEMTRR